MHIENCTALVTGANGGLGRELIGQLRARGARRIYAGVRNVAGLEIPGAEVIRLDITDPRQVFAAAQRASDTTLLINNAGVGPHARLVDGDIVSIRAAMDTHFFGTLSVIRALAPVLGANGGGAMLNMLSVLSWLQFPGGGPYGAANAAEWSLTDTVRLELAPQGTLVTALHAGPVDTDMMSGFDGTTSRPADIAAAGLDAIENDVTEVLADDFAVAVKTSLALTPSERYAPLLKRAASARSHQTPPLSPS